MTDDVKALLAKARRHLEVVDQVHRVEGRQIAPTADQRIQLAQAYALLAIAARLNERAEHADGGSADITMVGFDEERPLFGREP